MRRLRPLVKHAWLGTLWLLGAFHWARRRLASEGAIVVLMFHRVLPDRDCERTRSLPGMVIHERTFADLVEHVSRRSMVVGAESARPGRNGTRTPRLVFTFDDGWEDNATVAFPIAAGRRVPFTIFVCPGLMDQAMPFWTERAIAASGLRPDAANQFVEALKRLPPEERRRQMPDQSRVDAADGSPFDRTMSWETARRLQDGGVSFGSHSFAHEILTFLDPEALSRDLSRARSEIQAALGTRCDLLAYPNGNTSDGVASASAAAGHAVAFTTQPSVWMRDTHPHRVPRVNMWDGKVTAPTGRFSALAFDYSVHWRPFMTWVAEAQGLNRLRRFVGSSTVQ